jgi:alkylhydroperoxidase family enzyme
VGRLADAVEFGAGNDDRLPADDAQQAALMALARAGSFSPAQIDEDVAAACRDSAVSSASIVELVTWLSVLGLLHRLTAWTLPAA